MAGKLSAEGLFFCCENCASCSLGYELIVLMVDIVTGTMVYSLRAGIPQYSNFLIIYSTVVT